MNNRDVEMSINDVENENKFLMRALKFAIVAHHDQIRRNDPEVPYIVHPIRVANILKKYKADRYLIAAAYLHNTVDSTDFSIQDIEKYFGFEVKKLVIAITERDKSIPWIDRKQEMIDRTKKLDFRTKTLIAADKLANLIDFNEYFESIGYHDFSKYHATEEQQEWYYRNLYFSLIKDQDENYPLFVELKNNINEVFDRNMEDYFTDTISLKKLNKY